MAKPKLHCITQSHEIALECFTSQGAFSNKDPSCEIIESTHATIRIQTAIHVQCQLWVEDFLFKPNNYSERRGEFEYHFDLWVHQGDRKESIFRNYIGKSTLTIQCNDEYYFCQLQVNSHKIDNSSYFEMVECVEERFPGTALSSMSLTEVPSSSSSSGLFIKRSMVRHATQTLNDLGKVIDNILRNPRKQVSKHYDRVPNSKGRSFHDANTLRWITQNPSHITPCDKMKSGAFILGNNFFSIDSPLQGQLFENTDVYENRVVLGLISSISDYLIDLQHYFENLLSKGKQSPKLGFSKLISRLAQKSFVPLLEEISTAIKFANVLSNKLTSRLVITHPIKEIPSLTPIFRSSPSYQQVFGIAQRWYSYFKTNLEHDEKLHPVSSIADIFEIFCLIKIDQALIEIGFCKA